MSAQMESPKPPRKKRTSPITPEERRKRSLAGRKGGRVVKVGATAPSTPPPHGD